MLGEADQAGDADKRAAARVEAIKTGLGIGAGTTGIFALLLAVRRQQHTESDATEKNVTELYTKAADQLGSEQAPVRLAGLYALERLAHNNPGQRQSIVNVICAYLRMPFTPPDPKPPAATEDTQLKEHQGRVQEQEVRLAAQRILVQHHQPEVRRTFWTDIDLDLTNAHLIGFTLDRCRVRKASFDGATFAGDAWFREATFTGEAWFVGATFTRDAWFDGVTFTGDAWFGDATFTRDAWFDGVTFTGHAWFVGATFTGRASFDKATFTGDASFGGATFTSGVQFGGASFSKATFTGGASFEGTTFSVASFHLATFTGGASFSGTTFTGHAGFRGATFTGHAGFVGATFTGSVRFVGATFTGNLRFNEAIFTGDASFVGATFTGSVQFDEARFTRIVELDSVTVVGGARFARATFYGRPGDLPDLRALLGTAVMLARTTCRSAIVDPQDLKTVTSRRALPKVSSNAACITHLRGVGRALPADHRSSGTVRQVSVARRWVAAVTICTRRPSLSSSGRRCRH
ncbi:hypothetical protein GCM10017567_57400 [Amycolatopsis bullii]|uniref:Pentapeptide repeat-containing protein n=1 Tax=Amycolatopsis bullii TaxID=941987 RepID=A0ABQ3KJG8_9PSEU|nr:hypothetical protein GCM10017567_57400 [Amycolatopsis bullii]